MPIYEYDCAKCQFHFEVLVHSAKEGPGACPKCGHSRVIKGFSAFAVASSASRESAPLCSGCPSAGGGCAAEGCASSCPMA
jgi:putative FmdB family regulatory protein